jgi:hypothetical protein
MTKSKGCVKLEANKEIKMDWVQFVIFFVGIVGLFVWNRTESRTDIRHMDNKLDANRDLINAIHAEMKDFHFRLLEIEKARK